MANIKDVARAAKVSTATVSAVLNDTAYVSPDLRSRVLAAIKELNYSPSLAARSLKRGRSQLIALVVADLANPFFQPVLRQLVAIGAKGVGLYDVRARIDVFPVDIRNQGRVGQVEFIEGLVK